MSSRHSFLSTTSLLRSPSAASLAPSIPATPSSTRLGRIVRGHKRTPNDSNPVEVPNTQPRRLCGDNGIIPLGPMFVVGIAIVISLCFIGAISFAFIGAEDELIFRDVLNELALVFIGDNVDVDIDEPAVTVRWSILACGTNFTLPGSEGTHGNGTLRVVDSNNESIPVIRLLTVTDTSSFIISSSDSASYVMQSDATQLASRNIEMGIVRPGEARFFALMLFGINWMLAHATVAYVALAWKSDGTERVVKYLVFCIVTMLVIPQVRNAMPDAPGLDGILIDQIGFFSQMLLTSIAVILLIAMLARRELASFEAAEPVRDFVKERPAPISKGLHKLRTGSSTSVDFRHIRNLSRTLSGRVPPSPIQEHPTASPFSDHNGVALQETSSRLQPPTLSINGQM
ncbi:hypothetical protein EIP86_003724 [Pleurotus ostreatoroseus]|nr:hypothetical protein EIP86_003724 [Pleurotus ostreatoroseus]